MLSLSEDAVGRITVSVRVRVGCNPDMSCSPRELIVNLKKKFGILTASFNQKHLASFLVRLAEMANEREREWLLFSQIGLPFETWALFA